MKIQITVLIVFVLIFIFASCRSSEDDTLHKSPAISSNAVDPDTAVDAEEDAKEIADKEDSDEESVEDSAEDTEQDVLIALGSMAQALKTDSCLDPLIDRLHQAELVLLGEATHGTSEFYTKRAEISRRLIEEHGFRYVVVEGDWATSHLLNRYVKQLPNSESDARKIMKSFSRWPTWMWANEEILGFIEWLREYNRKRPLSKRIGFYGMDVYGHDNARDKVISGLKELEADFVEQIEELYKPFDAFRDNPTHYAKAVARGGQPLDKNAEEALKLIKKHSSGLSDSCRYTAFHIEQSARVVKAAERHYRAMAGHGNESWNERADHFIDVVRRIRDFYAEDSRGIVWAHNTHVGDARATPMASQGRRNIGKAARKLMGREQVAILGFGTHRGTVKAGGRWGAQRELMVIPEAIEDSLEDLMNRLDMPSALFIFKPDELSPPLLEPFGHRAIGVVYRPQPESPGQYVPTLLPHRYDAFIFIAQTRALRPLHP